jgi:hypothetical protein
MDTGVHRRADVVSMIFTPPLNAADPPSTDLLGFSSTVHEGDVRVSHAHARALIQKWSQALPPQPSPAATAPRSVRATLPGIHPSPLLMARIHFVERKNNVTRIAGTTDEWESGFWVVSEETAQGLVGGDLYLHSNQDAPSHFGGTILSHRVVDDPSRPDICGRLIFRIRATMGHKGFQAGRAGWGNEKKIVP